MPEIRNLKSQFYRIWIAFKQNIKDLIPILGIVVHEKEQIASIIFLDYNKIDYNLNEIDRVIITINGNNYIYECKEIFPGRLGFYPRSERLSVSL